jgi:hypothetical protein
LERPGFEFAELVVEAASEITAHRTLDQRLRQGSPDLTIGSRKN